MRIALFALGCLGLWGCPKPQGGGLLSEVMKGLNDRDRALSSYHFTATSTEAGVEAQHEFFFRSPNREKGVVTRPVPMTVSFDGTRLYRLLPQEKKLEVFSLKVPVEKAAFFLSTTFTPFVPEGFRAPLVPKGAVAKKVSHPRATEAVELTVTTKGEVEVVTTYFLRFPQGDFLGKRVVSPQGTSEVVVSDEQCFEKPLLCLPRVLTTTEGGKTVMTVNVKDIELNPSLPNDDFALNAPSGWATEPHEVIEQGL